jgi:hypothetical protein
MELDIQSVGFGLDEPLVVLGQGEGGVMKRPFWKSFYSAPSVSEEHPSRAVTIQQELDERRACGVRGFWVTQLIK